MPTKVRAIVVIAAIAIAFGAVFVLTVPREPVYAGKPLAYWLEAYAGEPVSNSSPPRPSRDEADAAIRAMGTNAIPALLRRLQYRPSTLGLKIRTAVQKLRFPRLDLRYPYDTEWEAMQGLRAFHSNAAPAVPQLISICEHSSVKDASLAFASLGYIGPPAAQAVPMLLSIGSNVGFHDSTLVFALSSIHADPNDVVPKLALCLSDPDPQVQMNAILGLKNFGPAARLAIPALRELLQDTNRSSVNANAAPWHARTLTIGYFAEDALKKIAPADSKIGSAGR